MAVIAGAHEHLARPQEVDAAVADVRPAGVAVADEAECAGRPRLQVQGQAGAEADDRLVGVVQRPAQEHGQPRRRSAR